MAPLPLLVGILGPPDFQSRSSPTLVDAVVAAEACAPAWAAVDENVPIGRAAHRARLLVRLAAVCPLFVATDSESRSAGASTLFRAPAAARYSKLAPWGSYEDLRGWVAERGVAPQDASRFEPALPTIQRRDRTDPVLASKRMRVLETNEGIYLAGEFSQEPAGVEGVAVCDEPDHDHRVAAPPAPEIGCWVGFSAHTERWATHSYAPMDGPFVEVALSGTIAVCGTPMGARHLSAGRQQILSATLTMPADDGYARMVDADGTVTLRPGPPSSVHGSVPLEVITASLESQGIIVAVRSWESSENVRRLQQRLPLRRRPFPLP